MATAYPQHSAENLAQSRYTDIKEEPIGKLLTPIGGYQNEPLLSLEEAISCVSHFFIDLEQNVYIAKYNCQNPKDGLSQDESAAIHLYTMQFESGDSLYVVLNRILRAEKRDHLVPWFKYLKLLITALFKLNSIHTIVWRGVRNVDLSQKYTTGTQFAWWGISSCTTTPDVLETSTFLGKTGIRTLFSIECMNGKSIKNHSFFSDTEKEIILMPGTFFEVIGQVNPAEGLHIIHLKEIQPPFPLIKSPFVPAGRSEQREKAITRPSSGTNFISTFTEMHSTNASQMQALSSQSIKEKVYLEWIKAKEDQMRKKKQEELKLKHEQIEKKKREQDQQKKYAKDSFDQWKFKKDEELKQQLDENHNRKVGSGKPQEEKQKQVLEADRVSDKWMNRKSEQMKKTHDTNKITRDDQLKNNS